MRRERERKKQLSQLKMWQSVSGVTAQQHTLKKLNHKLKADMRTNAAKQEEKEKKDPI